MSTAIHTQTGTACCAPTNSKSTMSKLTLNTCYAHTPFWRELASLTQPIDKLKFLPKVAYTKPVPKPLLQKCEKLAGGKKGLLQSLQKQEVFVRAIQGWKPAPLQKTLLSSCVGA